MKIFRKIKQRWQWITGYKVMFVTPRHTYTVEHRIGRKPEMISEKTPDTLLGSHASMITFDEVSSLSEAEIAELKRPTPDGNILFKREYMCDWPKIIKPKEEK